MKFLQHLFPEVGSVWRYRKHPERSYRVIGVANASVRHPRHPLQVVYATVGHEDRLWTCPLEDWHTRFAFDTTARGGDHAG